jgi:hypothetical protein
MTLLVDLFDHVMGSDDTARQQATDMLNTVPDISSDEGSPTRATDEPKESRKERLTTAHAAMISLQGSMTMALEDVLDLTSMILLRTTMEATRFHFWFSLCGRCHLQHIHGGCCAAHFFDQCQYRLLYQLNLQSDRWLHSYT